jgi:hypothetical protein
MAVRLCRGRFGFHAPAFSPAFPQNTSWARADYTAFENPIGAVYPLHKIKQNVIMQG